MFDDGVKFEILEGTPRADLSTWLMVFALGRMDPGPEPAGMAIEFFRTRAEVPVATLVVLSLLPALPREDGGAVMCSFC